MLQYLVNTFKYLINNKHFQVYELPFYIFKRNFHEQYLNNNYCFLIG
jgi:hypothetical protein